MRTLVIGDIHGCNTALNALLEVVVPADEDRLITVGDYIDRGPDSYAVMEWARSRTAEGKLIPLLGNHEIMMLMAVENTRARNNWFQFGGVEALESYVQGTGGQAWGAVPDSHWTFLENLHAWFETETHIFVHAGVNPDRDLKDQEDSDLFWERFINPPPHKSGKTVICGHTIQEDGHPRSVGHAICIDTGVYEPLGWLTCLHVESGHYWQANQKGATREGELESSR